MRVLNVLSIIGGLFFAWIAFSGLDVISHNLTDCTYAVWNFFALIIK
jgi:hypothetical protein